VSTANGYQAESSFLGKESADQSYPNSLVMDQHQKSRGHAILFGYVSEK
jgi:hypothetical protein